MSIIDGFWSLGFVAMAWSQLVGAGRHSQVIALVVGLWGIRLSAFLLMRNWGQPEDYRYAAWRKDWGERTPAISYFKVFWLQYVLMLVVGIPLWGRGGGGDFDPLQFKNILAIALFILGFCWESVADYQKWSFKKVAEQRHKVCRVGLWRFSRHPNYFGEMTLWYGIGLLSMASWSEWYLLLGPACLHFLLVKVSGIPLIEAKQKNNPEYLAYMHSTPALLPRFWDKDRD